MNPDLHLVRMNVDTAALYRFARKSHLPARDFDDGYAVHAFMAALFDHGASPETRAAPKPFRVIDPTRRVVEVLGYAALDHRALAQRAKSFADPVVWGVCDVDRMASRPVPKFEQGAQLGFSVRVCPVRRVAKRGNQQKARAEIDVFLAKAWELNNPEIELDREAVYRDWLAEEIEKDGAAELRSAVLESFRLGRQHRRTHGQDRQGARVRHPEAHFDGVLVVRDPALFAARLRRGLGRHRSFGFGMLLLKPARS